MSRLARIFVLSLVFSLISLGQVTQAGAQEPGYNSLSPLVKKLSPSVVNISTTNVSKGRTFSYESPFKDRENDPFNEFFDKFFGQQPEREFRGRGLGSGFIFSEDGYIVTNNHVVEKATDIKVILQNGDIYSAEVIGTDPKTDLALLKIEPKEKLPAVEFGNSDSLEIGDWVLAIGNPFGLGHTVTAGIISAKGRSLGLGSYDDFIQTDAAINPGNSGGPLFNLRGEVIGMNSQIVSGTRSNSGIGFAIPVNLVKRVAQDILQQGRVEYSYLGITGGSEMSLNLIETLGLPNNLRGVVVSGVVPGGPAERGGLQNPGRPVAVEGEPIPSSADIITAINGIPVAGMNKLVSYLASYTRPGDTVNLTVWRSGQQLTLPVQLTARPQ